LNGFSGDIMNKFKKDQYEHLLVKRKKMISNMSNKKTQSRQLSEFIKKIDEEMDYRDYNEEW